MVRSYPHAVDWITGIIRILCPIEFRVIEVKWRIKLRRSVAWNVSFLSTFPMTWLSVSRDSSGKTSSLSGRPSKQEKRERKHIRVSSLLFTSTSRLGESHKATRPPFCIPDQWSHKNVKSPLFLNFGPHLLLSQPKTHAPPLAFVLVESIGWKFLPHLSAYLKNV